MCGKEAYCTDPCAGKEAYRNDPCAGKGYSHGCPYQEAGIGVEQRYWPHTMGSGGEVKQTSIKGNRSHADIR